MTFQVDVDLTLTHDSADFHDTGALTGLIKPQMRKSEIRLNLQCMRTKTRGYIWMGHDA